MITKHVINDLQVTFQFAVLKSDYNVFSQKYTALKE